MKNIDGRRGGILQKKALGCDGWRAFELGSLPDDALGCFVGCINSFVDEGEFPAQLGLNIMAMLKKPQGGFRCVAKTHMWYRLFAFVRRSVVKEWELGMMGDFDTAAPGQQALDAALRRSLFGEIASWLGDSFSCIFWGYEKFFDSIAPELLLKEAIALNFPLTDLCLVLQMHLSPRRLQAACALSVPIVPGRSIIAGCGYSVALTRLYLRRPIGALVDEHPRVEHGVYIDDIGQLAYGGLLSHRRDIVAAGVGMVHMSNRLKLKISTKSVVVSSDPGTARILVRKLCALGVKVAVAEQAKDLGYSSLLMSGGGW